MLFVMRNTLYLFVKFTLFIILTIRDKDSLKVKQFLIWSQKSMAPILRSRAVSVLKPPSQLILKAQGIHEKTKMWGQSNILI